MVGAELREARLALGLDPHELGALVGGVHGRSLLRWERSERAVPAWVEAVVCALLAGDHRHRARLPRLSDALRVAGPGACLALWGLAGSMPARAWWVWVRRSPLAAMLRASDPPPCAQCHVVGGHKLGCTIGAVLRLGGDPKTATVRNGLLLCRLCKEGGAIVPVTRCQEHPQRAQGCGVAENDAP